MGRIQENLIGRTFGLLRVVEEGSRHNGRLLWRCRCECGRWKEVAASHLKSGSISSCGCIRGKPRENLEGQTFGQLLVVGPSEVRRGWAYWRCQCICGAEKMIAAKELKRGGTTSCGCNRGHARGEQLRTHGESYKNETPEHRIWGAMHSRCEWEGNKAYKYYGARGIKVCNRWSGQDGYTNFLEDMGRRPSSKHSIERKNNDGDYAPQNCIWATQLVQAANRRNNHNVTFKGETLHLSEWARRYNLKPPTLRMRLKKGWSTERALTTPNQAKIDQFREQE